MRMTVQIKNYKAFLFDVDKTLTNSKQEITPHTKEALRILHKNWYLIGVCTGQHYATLKNFVLPHFPDNSLHVVSGGAQVMNKNGEVRWERLIPYAVAMKIVRDFEAYGAAIYICANSHIFGNARARSNWKDSVLPIYQLENFPAIDAPIMILENITPQVLEKLFSNRAVSYKLLKTYSGEFYADVTAREVSKAVGLRRWCALQKITPREVIGFGDSDNDIEFLKSVGYAVAVGNATETIKTVADEIAESSDDDGMARWILRQVK